MNEHPDNEQLEVEVEIEVVERKPPISLTEAKRKYTNSVTLTTANDDLCIRDASYYHGDQLSDEQRERLRERGQPEVEIPRVTTSINGVLGLITASETVPECFAVDPENGQNSADIGTKVLRNLCTVNNMPRLRRNAFMDMLLYGTCAFMVGRNATRGAETILTEHILWEDFFYDPYSRLADFADASYLGIKRWVEAGELKKTYPDTYDEVSPTFEQTGSFIDSKDTAQSNLWIDHTRQRVRVIEMYLNTTDGWQKLVFCDKGFFEFGLSPYVDDNGHPICPIVALSYKVNRTKDTLERYGPIRQAITLQNELNSRRSRMLHVTNSRQVRIVDQNADLAEKNLAVAEAAKPNGVLPFGYDVIPTQDIFQGNAMLMQQTEHDFDRMFPTPAVLGRAQSDLSGKAYQQLMQAGYTEWADAFAGFDDAVHNIFKRMWFAAKQFMTGPQWIRVTNEARAAEFVQVNVPTVGHVPTPLLGPDGQQQIDPYTGKPRYTFSLGIISVEKELAKMDVDITISTVPVVENFDMEVWKLVFGWAQSLQMNILDPAFEAALQLLPIPNKTRTIERLKATREQLQGQAQQAQMMQMQAQMQQAQVEQQGAMAKAAKETAQAKKAEAEAVMINQQTAGHQHNQEMAALLAAIKPHPGF